MGMRIRRGKKVKTPSTWEMLSWIERLVYYGGPFMIAWMVYMIITS